MTACFLWSHTACHSRSLPLKKCNPIKPRMKKVLKYGCFGIMGICLLLIIGCPILIKQAFGPINEIVEIDQEIGGKLICKSEYNADMASWFYNIDFLYESEKGKINRIGSGEYYGRSWNKDEQLFEVSEWMILKTGAEFGADKLLIGKTSEDNWKEFKISPSEIEKDSLWISKNILVKQNSRPQESFVKEITKNKIEVEYLYRIGETVKEQEARLITYEIDEKTGIPKMNKIEMIK